MLSFFHKKYFIVDYLEGLTDMHCHILPGIDDGAKNEAIALEMLGLYTDLGYKGVIATPHIMEGYYNNTAAGIKETLKDLESVMSENGYGDFHITAASEYMLDEGFDKLSEQKDLLTIKGNKVLVEMSYLQKSVFVDTQIFDLQQQGFEPILAHPERYPYLANMEQILKFKEHGCLLQLNLLALNNHYGAQAGKQALTLLSNGKYDFLGTDAHHPEHLKSIKKIAISKKLVPNFEALVEKTKIGLID
jgi:protein-tyrosine phosphatase